MQIKKIISSWNVEISLLTRNFWFWLTLLLSLLITALQFNVWGQQFDPGGTLTFTAFIVQGGLLYSMFLGLNLVTQELRNHSHEIFYILPNGYSIKMIAKSLSLLTVIVFFYVLSLIILFFLYWYYEVPVSFYWKAVFYIALYWGIPFWISGTIGMVIGSLVNFRIALFLLVITWLFIGPLNYYFWGPIMALTKTNLNNIMNFFNLGQTDPSLIYDPVYGLPMEVYRWLQKAIWLVFTTFFFFIAIFQRTIKNRTKLLITTSLIFALLLSPLIFFFSQNEQVVWTRDEYNSVNNYDLNYYMKNSKTNFPNKDRFNIESYKIDLNIFRTLKAQVKVKLKPLTATDTLTFTLYHDLKIKSVAMEKKSNLNFKQQGDQVQVFLPSLIKPNMSIIITFNYEGTSSPYFYANQQAVMLPNYFAWLPVAGSYPTMKINGSQLFTYPLYPRKPTYYVLRYSGPGPLYTNLPNTNSNEWKGTTNNGITLAAGMLTEKDVDQIKVYYPISLYKMVGKVPPFLKKIKEAGDKINIDLGLEIPKQRKIFFLSIPYESRNDFTIWSFDDHLIIKVNQMWNETIDYYSGQVLEGVLNSLIRDETFNQKEDMKELFIYSYSYWHNLKEKSNTKELEFYESFLQTNSSDLKNFIRKNISNDKLMRSFLKDWLKQLSKEQEMTYVELNELIKAKESEK